MRTGNEHTELMTETKFEIHFLAIFKLVPIFNSRLKSNDASLLRVNPTLFPLPYPTLHTRVFPLNNYFTIPFHFPKS